MFEQTISFHGHVYIELTVNDKIKSFSIMSYHESPLFFLEQLLMKKIKWFTLNRDTSLFMVHDMQSTGVCFCCMLLTKKRIKNR